MVINYLLLYWGDIKMEKKFGEVEIGQRFFDYYSGEYWIKTSDTEATLDSGGDALGGIDMFNANEEVEV
jgi:hypothetical protein